MKRAARVILAATGCTILDLILVRHGFSQVDALAINLAMVLIICGPRLID